MRKLIIAEKPKLGREAICPALSNNWKKEKTHWENSEYVVTWGYGHLFELRLPEEYDEKYKVRSLANYPCLPEKYEIVLSRERDAKGAIKNFKKADSGKKAQFDFIKSMINSNDIDEIMAAGDPDTEGEAIVNDILDMAGNKKPVTRLWILDYTPETIKSAVKNRKDYSLTKGWAESARARRISDWIFGMNGSTMVMAKYFNKTGISVGRVQTPLLKLLVDREKEILNFKPEQYYLGRGIFKEKKQGQEYQGTLLNEKGENARLKEPYKFTNTKEAKVISVDVSPKQTVAPKLYSTTSARKDILKILKVSSKVAEETMQTLYENQMISYPRSETEFLPTTMEDDAKRIMKTLPGMFNDKPYNRATISVGNKNVFRSTDSGDIGSHYAIIPTGKNNLSKLSDIEKKVFEIIVNRFLVAFMPPYKYSSTKIITEIPTGEKFATSGTMTLDAGWKEVDGMGEDKAIPKVSKDEMVDVKKLDSEEKWTEPPSRYTEGDLEDLMKSVHKFVTDPEAKKILKENAGLGTPATRPDIIARLEKQELLMKEKKGKTTVVFPSEKAMHLIEVVPSELSDPVTTALWQSKLDELKDNKNSHAMDFVKNIVTQFKEIANLIKNDTRSKISIVAASDVIGTCPLCKDGKVVGSVKAFNCSNWNNKENPCKFTIWKNQFEKLGKKTISDKEIKTLLEKGKIKVSLTKKDSKDKYEKEINLKIENNVAKLDINWGDGISVSTEKQEEIGTCPVCKKGKIVENSKAFGCSEWKTGCKYSIWKNSLEKFKGKELKSKNIKELLDKGELLVTLEDKNGNKSSKKITIDEKYGIKINF